MFRRVETRPLPNPSIGRQQQAAAAFLILCSVRGAVDLDGFCRRAGRDRFIPGPNVRPKRRMEQLRGLKGQRGAAGELAADVAGKAAVCR